MTRILLLGGYGGFGARIARRLGEAGFTVLVAGRRLERAEAFCAGRPNLVPVAVDRDHGLEDALARLGAEMLIDASGPFQGADYRVPRACIAARIHYLDIADARDFVCGIGSLDAAARDAGIVMISGASSVPALSGAALRELAHGMEDIRAIEMAISASSRATAGPSVASAILEHVGKPIRRWHGGRWSIGHGWQEMRYERFAVDGVAPLDRRLVALADIPDLALLPARVLGRPAVTFRAGTELAVQNIALWLASWVVRRGWIANLAALSRQLGWAQRMMAGLGGDRSAMVVCIFGHVSGDPVERRWTLIAGAGDGPEIPALAAPILARRVAAGMLNPGARDAGTLLALTDFEPAFAGLSIVHQQREIAQPLPLYARVMGERFGRLPPAVRAMHAVLRDGGASGRATVTRGRHPLARLIARVVGFPPEGEHALHVHFQERDGVETWTRCFSSHAFHSRLSQRGKRLVERFGPLSFGFDLPSDGRGLTMVMRGWRLLGLPLPLMFAPRSEAREWEEEGRFHFDVSIALPLIGPIVHYRGWLDSDPGARQSRLRGHRPGVRIDPTGSSPEKRA